MINLSKIKTNQISGMNTEDLSFLELLTSEDTNEMFNQFTGLTDAQAAIIEESAEHFGDISSFYPDLGEDIKKEIALIEEEAKNKRTSDQTKQYVNKFKSFLRDEKLPTNIEKMPVRYLSQYLRFWYSKLTTLDGKLYSPSSLICMRAAIHRYLSADIGRPINILKDVEFNESNNMIKCMIAKYLKSTKTINSNENGARAIDSNDLLKLGDYFSRKNPHVLQQEVIFLIIYHFAYRGREWIRNLEKESIVLSTDSNGREFVICNKNLQEKNVKASLRKSNYDNIKDIVMYATPEKKDKCPVEAIRLYLSKIPRDCTCLFPKPLKKTRSKDNEWEKESFWYSDKQVVGKHTLNDAMKLISEEAELSAKYTNHCVRATVVSEMFSKGYTTEQIQTVTGHKRNDSVQRYIKRVTPSKKMKVSHDLSSSIHRTQNHDEIVPTDSTPGPSTSTFSETETTHYSVSIRDTKTTTVSVNESKTLRHPTSVLKKNGFVLEFYLD